MRILLDTHILLWSLFESRKLSDKAKRIIMDPDNILYVSSASVWEVSIKSQKPNAKINISGGLFSHYCKEAGFIPLNINASHAITTESLQIKDGLTVNHDPFDRILLAQAKTENMYLLTHDKMFMNYDEKCILFD